MAKTNPAREGQAGFVKIELSFIAVVLALFVVAA